MSVRRRVTGSLAAFLAAVAVVGTAQAQPPLPFGPRPVQGGFDRELSTDEVKNRLESLLNRGKPGGQFPPGFDPRQVAEMMKQFGFNPDKNSKLDPEHAERLKRFLDQNPQLKQHLERMRPDGKMPPTPPDNGKGTRPVDPGFKNQDFKNPFDGLKVDPPAKRPQPDFPPLKDVPSQKGKGFNPNDPVRPPGNENPIPPPPPVRENNPVAPPMGKDRMPWEEPESPQEKARQAAAAMWEKSVGPLDETPAVKKALFDIVDGTGDLTDPDGNSLWDTLSKEFGDGKSFGDLLDGVDTGGGWNLGGDWEFPKFNWNFNWATPTPPKLDPDGPAKESWWSRWRRPSSTSGSSSGSNWFSGWRLPRWNIGVPSIDGTVLPFLFLIAALVGGVFLWRWLARRNAPPPRIDPYALGPWPVDPHHLTTRQDVVAAFEHLSVLICGPVAKTWTHTTIAGALSELAMAEPRRAMLLARLYELARYTPADEPLSTAELAEARRIVCQLAGFSDD